MSRPPHPSDFMTSCKSCIIIIIIIIIDTLIYCIFKIADCPETVLILPSSYRQVLRQCITLSIASFAFLSIRLPHYSVTGPHKFNVGLFPVPLYELSWVWRYRTFGRVAGEKGNMLPGKAE
jgi:hypothetical protein